MWIRLGHRRVQLRPPGADIRPPRGEIEFRRIESRHHHLVAKEPALGQDLAKGIEDQGAARLDGLAVGADRIGVDEINAVLIGSGRQPAHQPAAAFGSVELLPAALGIALAIFPNLRRDHAPARHGAGQTAGDMRDQNDLGAPHRRQPDIFGQVRVVANEHAEPRAQKVKHRVAVTASQLGADKGMDLAMLGDQPVAIDDDAGVVEMSAVLFEEAGRESDAQRIGERDQPLDRPPAGNRFGKLFDLAAREIFKKGIAGDRALVEADQFGSFGGGFAG